jgi:hypothetical protein
VQFRFLIVQRISSSVVCVASGSTVKGPNSGTATTPASKISGCITSIDSSATEEMFSPPNHCLKEGKSLQGSDLIDWARNTSGISKFMIPREVEVVPTCIQIYLEMYPSQWLSLSKLLSDPSPSHVGCSSGFVTVKEGKSLQGSDLIDWARNTSGISKFMIPREVPLVFRAQSIKSEPCRLLPSFTVTKALGRSPQWESGSGERLNCQGTKLLTMIRRRKHLLRCTGVYASYASFLHCNKGFRSFAPVGVRNSNDTSLQNIRMHN